MAGKRKGVRMVQEIQRLKKLGLGKKAVARALRISRNTLKRYWDGEGEAAKSVVVSVGYHAPWSENLDWSAVKEAVRKGQALAHYWEELQNGLSPGDPLGEVSYVSFWREYRRRNPETPLKFGQVFPPGACCEIDYKGTRPGLGYTDPTTGTFVVCELFGAALGFSRYLFVDVTLTQQKADFYGSIDRAYRDFQGVPRISVTDNLTPAVKKAKKGDADLNPDYAAFCGHYGTVAIPARPRKPKDKNLIEGELKLFWRWVAHSLLGKTLTSLAALRGFIQEAAARYNDRVQRRMGESRRQRLEAERAAMTAVPEAPYEYSEWKKARPHPDCHIQIRKNYYSVPHALRGRLLDVRITARHIEVMKGGDRVALHALLPGNLMGRYESNPAHFPPAHQFLLETLPKTMREKAREVGPQTAALVEELFALGNHPLRYLRRVQGLLGLLKEATPTELEQAVLRARILGEGLPRPSILMEIVRQSRVTLPEVEPVERKPNRFLRGTRNILAGQEREGSVVVLEEGIGPETL